MRRTRPYLLVVLLLIGVCSLGLGAARVLGDERVLGGPLWMAPAGSSWSSIPIDLDQGGIIGVWFPSYPLPDGIVFEGVHLLGSEPWLVVRTGLGDCSIGAVRESPQACPGQQPVAGFRTGPGRRDVQLLVHLSLREPGSGGFTGVAVDYRVDGRHYRALYAQGGLVCAPFTEAGCDDVPFANAQDRLVEELERLSPLAREG